jgi:flavin reductase (DIM6/NTAB) family NADH-FMN oxidoreductase RutF
VIKQKTSLAHVASAEFTNAMSAAATGVTVVTTEGETGRFGITVSAIASVSAEPPMLLVCLNRKNPSVEAITHHGLFAVNILSEKQAEVARTFSGKPLDGDPYEFSEGQWMTSELGLPVLSEAAASFECEIETIHDAGTHRIFIGRVVSAERGAQPPLIYFNKHYAKVKPGGS